MDLTKLKLNKIKNKVDWKKKMYLLKKRFELSTLAKEFDTNYKVIWQWEVGKRIPSLDKLVLINNFCKKNRLRLF